MSGPAAIALWTGSSPRLDVMPIGDGLTLGRALVGDDRMSSNHVRLELRDGAVEIAELGSQNGTWLAGNRLTGKARPHLPMLVRAARTLFLVVADASRYAGVTIGRRDGLVVAASLPPIWRALDEAVLAEDCVVLEGAGSVARKLAASYAAQRGGTRVTFDGLRELEDLIEPASPPRTIILDGPLRNSDRLTLATWLETCVRVATVLDSVEFLVGPPLLSVRKIAIPNPRLDELPATFVDLAGDLPLHVSAVEALLLDAWRTGEDAALGRARSGIEIARLRGRTELRGEDMPLAPVHKNAMHPWSPQQG